MLSASISGVFALLIILQTLISVSALPVTTTTTSANTQLETRQTSESSGNNPSAGPPNNATTSDKVTAAQIAGVVIGALCTLALALIFWYCFLQHQRKKLEQRAIREKADAIENTKRADPSYDYPGSIYARSGA